MSDALRYLILFLLINPALAEQPCVVLPSTEPATGIASWSREGAKLKHTLTYLAGDYPKAFGFHNTVKDKDVDKIKAAGGRVIILSCT